ncbi:MAG TPA: hypothetical protein VD838_22490, partial [Anaeromyxobacteraceae bacterium]|nr:hypothetical protein [Anaeromyxobacteraceae bacterium]
AEAAPVRAAIAELLAAPAELLPPAPGTAPPLRAGTAVTTAARADLAALETGLSLLPIAVRELARALGAPLSPEDDFRLSAALDRARVAARAARSNGGA